MVAKVIKSDEDIYSLEGAKNIIITNLLKK